MTMKALKFWMRTGLFVLAAFALTSPPLNGGKTARTPAKEAIMLPAEHDTDLLPFEERILEEQDSSPIIRIGEKEIPRWMFQNAVRDRLLQIRKRGDAPAKIEEEIQQEVIDNLIQVELLAEEARRVGCGVNVAGGLLRSKVIEGSFSSTEAFHRTLEKAGMTRAQYAVLWQQQASVNQWVEEKVKPAIQVTAAEIEAARVAEVGEDPNRAGEKTFERRLAREIRNRKIREAIQVRTAELRAAVEIEVFPH